VGRTPSGDPEFTKFQATLVSKQIPIHVIRAGDVFNFGGANVTVVWPRFTVDPDAPSRNNDSVVLKVRFGQRTILLTGDIESEGEEAILKHLDSKLELRADVVKVAHHGSRTSSTAAFVSATHPDYAVISVGQNSVFGHPHKEVVERWRAEGAKILITGQSGMITVSTDGEKLEVTTFE
jgi:competence protein ComEC